MTPGRKTRGIPAGEEPNTFGGESRSRIRVGVNLAGAMSEAADKLLERAEQARCEKRLADAREDWLTAIELLRRDNQGEQLGQALRALGELERKLGDGQSARAHYEEAVALGRKHGDALRLAHTVRHLGDVYH